MITNIPDIKLPPIPLINIYRDGTRLFSGIPGNQKSPGILEKVKIFWNSGKTKTVV